MPGYPHLRRVLVFLLSAIAAFARGDVISLSAPLTETIYALGAQSRLAAVSTTSVFPDQVVADRRSGKLIEFGNFTRPDTVLIKNLEPALILTSTSLQRALAERLRAQGYKVLHFEPASMEDIFKQTEEIGEAVGKATEAKEMTRRMRAELAAIKAKSAALPKVRVYMEINHEGPWTVGSASPVNDSLEAAGGVNIFADAAQGAYTVSNAEVIRRNPDIIFSPIWLDAHIGGIDGIVTLASIYARPGYDAIKAVQTSRVLYYDSALLKHEGPRQILAIRKLAYLLHPEAFENPPDTIPWELGRIKQ